MFKLVTYGLIVNDYQKHYSYQENMNTLLNTKRTPLSLFIITAFTTISNLSLAQDQTVTDKSIETVVVTASGHEQIITQAPASITVITRDKLENQSYTDLTDALKEVPGVIVTAGGDGQDISIRGMPAQYTAILVDGRKQSGRELQTNGTTATEQDWLPPLNAIERIEIVRGPMSTLYGSDALGGVINIITRKEYQEWQGSLRVESTIQKNNKSGNINQGRLYLTGPVVEGLVSATITGLYQERKEDEIEGGYSGKKLDNYRLGLNFTPTAQDSISLDYSLHDQKRETTLGKSVPRESQVAIREYNRESIGLSHSGNYVWGNTSTFISTEIVENIGAQKNIQNNVFNTQWNSSLVQHFLTVGVSFEQKDLSDKKLGLSAKNEQWSLFSEDEWQLSDEFSLTIGLRYDQNEIFKGQFSPRLYGAWSFDEQWTIKGGVSTGYRAPTLTEMDKDWIQESCRGKCSIFGNPDLKPETSVNSEMGIYFIDNNEFSANLTLFYSNFKDKIERQNVDLSCTERTCDTTYINIEDATTYGSEISISKGITESITLSTSYSYTHTEKNTSDDDDGLPLVQAPEQQLAVKGDWAVRDNINSWFRVNYRSKEKENITSGSTRTLAPSLTYVDLGANWVVTKRAKLMGGIYNLLDKETTEEEYGYVNDGRRYWLAAELSF